MHQRSQVGQHVGWKRVVLVTTLGDFVPWSFGFDVNVDPNVRRGFLIERVDGDVDQPGHR